MITNLNEKKGGIHKLNDEIPLFLEFINNSKVIDLSTYNGL